MPAWHKKWTWLNYDEAENHVLCIICKNANDHGMLNNVKVEDSFVKTGHSNWKNARSADKVFQKHEFLECHQTAIQRHVEITKTAQDVSTKLKNNLTETQCENKASLLKIMSCLRYLYRQRLPFR